MTTSSGIQTFAPSLGDLTLEAFSRIQIRGPGITQHHMFDARMSANLLFSEWSNRQVNLWKVQLLQIPLIQGIANYPLPASVITLLDSYIRVGQMGPAQNLQPDLSTVLGSPTVRVVIANHGLSAGAYVAIVVPVSVGGLVLLGFYQAQTVIDANTFTITAPANATATVNGGGVVPVLSSTLGSASINVLLPAHGLSPQASFLVQSPTVVGGLLLQGTYSVATVVDANNFTFTSPFAAGATQAVAENAGLGIFETQLPPSTYQAPDYYLYPISRTEYDAQANKFTQARPTTYWFDRTVPPQITFWQVPDNNGPYTFFYHAVVQNDDAVLPGGVGLDIPYRFMEAYASGLAAKLGRKYAPQIVADLKMEAAMAWKEAAEQDTELTPLYIQPAIGSYFR